MSGMAITTRPTAGPYAQFGLREDPFPREPLAGAWVDIPAHEAALTTVRTWLADGTPAGLAVVSGAPGAGKTRSLTRLAQALTAAGPDRLIGVVPDDGARRSDAQLLRAAIVALGGTPTGRTGLELTTALRALLRTREDDPLPPALLVDHAALTGSQLEIVRAVLAPDETGEMRAQLVLFGPPELPDRIARRRSLAGALRHVTSLAPLDLAAMRALLDGRIEAVRDPEQDAGALFTPEASELVWQTSEGLPGMAIAIAHRALREAIATGARQVGPGLVAAASSAVAAGRSDPGAINTDGAIQTRLTLPGLDDTTPPRGRRRGRRP